MPEILSRRQLLLTGGALLFSGCGRFGTTYPRVEAGDLDPASPTIQPDSTPENFTPPTAVPPTPTPNFALTRVAILEAQAALNAAELEQAKAQLKAKEGQSTTTPVPPAPTLRPTSTSIPSSTPLPPTATRIPPTATKAIILSPTPNPEQLLIEDAKKATLNRWLEMMSFNVGELQYSSNPKGYGINNRPFMNTFHYPTYMDYEIVQKQLPSADPKSDRTSTEVLLPTFMRVRWHVQTNSRPYPNSEYSVQRTDTKGETELKDIRLELSHRKSLTSADRANGVEWESGARIDYTGRYRAVSFVHKSSLIDSGPLTHPFPEAKWSDTSFSFEIKRTRGRWEISPLLHLQQVVTPILGVRESLYVRNDVRANCSESQASGPGCKIQLPL